MKGGAQEEIMKTHVNAVGFSQAHCKNTLDFHILWIIKL